MRTVSIAIILRLVMGRTLNRAHQMVNMPKKCPDTSSSRFWHSATFNAFAQRFD